ncbi:unnamed protein product [Lota lota]
MLCLRRQGDRIVRPVRLVSGLGLGPSHVGTGGGNRANEERRGEDAWERSWRSWRRWRRWDGERPPGVTYVQALTERHGKELDLRIEATPLSNIVRVVPALAGFDPGLTPPGVWTEPHPCTNAGCCSSSVDLPRAFLHHQHPDGITRRGIDLLQCLQEQELQKCRWLHSMPPGFPPPPPRLPSVLKALLSVLARGALLALSPSWSPFISPTPSRGHLDQRETHLLPPPVTQQR